MDSKYIYICMHAKESKVVIYEMGMAIEKLCSYFLHYDFWILKNKLFVTIFLEEVK